MLEKSTKPQQKLTTVFPRDQVASFVSRLKSKSDNNTTSTTTTTIPIQKSNSSNALQPTITPVPTTSILQPQQPPLTPHLPPQVVQTTQIIATPSVSTPSHTLGQMQAQTPLSTEPAPTSQPTPVQPQPADDTKVITPDVTNPTITNTSSYSNNTINANIINSDNKNLSTSDNTNTPPPQAVNGIGNTSNENNINPPVSNNVYTSINNVNTDVQKRQWQTSMAAHFQVLLKHPPPLYLLYWLTCIRWKQWRHYPAQFKKNRAVFVHCFWEASVKTVLDSNSLVLILYAL